MLTRGLPSGFTPLPLGNPPPGFDIGLVPRLSIIHIIV